MARVPHANLDCSPGCPVEGVLALIGGKWKGLILYHLLDGTLRFNEIRRRVPNVTQRMLTTQLRELEADGLLVRTVYAEVPPRVEYSLSPRGRSLEPIILALKAWGEEHLRPAAAVSDAASAAVVAA
ncbi:HxlR family transcriptional regulator [Azospirillum brasilense]|uniref:HxlR family transcriptional regulator n=1 Tax=Azospirillum brasilense TaxID=192 RepID=A0A560B026_AZOBR|nr:helix-turn-helix domain-containing protein [Azospirillum brasilense]TWA65974.1 HxlR family transcriptional regulator [Azospirillum brasilense]